MDDKNSENAPTNSQSLALRIQKKIASKMSNKNVAKIFIDETSGRILDNLSRLVKEYSNSKKQSELILNDMIKIIVKVGLLFKNDQLNQEELKMCNSFRQGFHQFVKKALSFYERTHPYDYQQLYDILKNCQNLIHTIVKQHLTDKSKNRIDNIFNFFTEKAFLEDVFKNQKFNNTMRPIVEDTRRLVDEGYL